MKINHPALFAATCVFLGVLSSCVDNKKSLPIYGERTPVQKEVNGNTVTDTVYKTIPDFQLINQDSVLLTQDFFKDKIYIANFFFTNCPSICPTMQRNLLKVYEKYKNDSRIAFLSHSIDFKYDQPHVLKEYANKLGVDNDQWQFVRGSRAEIYGLADHYMVYATEDAAAPGGYDHQSYFLLVDKERRIRGAYDGTLDEQVENLQRDIEILLQEYER